MQHDAQDLPTRGFVDYLLILGQRKRFIALNVIVITLLAAGVSLVLPKSFESSSTIMPPKNQNALNLLSLSSSSLMRQFSPLRALSGSLSPDLYGYVSILKSRTLLGLTVRKFGLIERYGVRNMTEAMKALQSNFEYTVNEESTITLIVNDEDPVVARDMVVYVVRELDSLQRDLSVREARENRMFIEHRLEQNREDMRTSELAMKDFQEKNGVIAVPSDAAASVSAYADVYAQKMLKEFEVGYLERALGAENPQLQAERMQLKEMNKQLANVPGQGVEFIRLYRDFMIQQKLFEILLPMYEQSRIEEQRNTPTLLVLDAAAVPERHTSPKRMIITAVFFVLSIIFSIAVVMISTRLDDLHRVRPGQYARLMQVAGPFRRLMRARPAGKDSSAV